MAKVHLFAARGGSGSPTPPAGLLDPDEQARAARKLDEEDRRLFVAARALVRVALSFLDPCPAASWRFRYDARGKPAVIPSPGVPDLRFSVSHTRGLVVCAVIVGRDIGCDAEALSRPALTPETLELCFTASERETLESCAPSERHARSLRLFTLKEAYVKARGLGLALDLQSFEVGLSPPALLRPPPDHAGAWTFAQPVCGRDHVVGLAVPDATLECGPILWPFEG